ncbi:tape measure protein [Erwinia aphidicola]|uniref:tape measure protein n=1 Tax=Erwinia aphidicola TaxID=68334 RepID=UPI003018F5F0
MAENVGGIYIEIDMETAKLLQAQRKVNDQLGIMEGRFDNTAKSVAGTEKAFSSLTKVASALAAAISVQQIAEYGNAWVTVNNKLANSVRANEQLADVTQRVFDISQNTRSSIEATATLYGRLERSTRSAGTSTADLIKLTTTINKGLTVSGATTEEASSTMTQLSQALASGVLRGEEFNSISENGSRLAVALADSLGVTIGQLRGMAAQGKLTTAVVVNGLLKQSDAIAKEFANTALTMGQAFTVATNNITKFVGESSSVSTSINVFNRGVISLSENLDAVANVIGVAAAVFGGRFAGALAVATAAQATAIKTTIQGIAATRTRAKEELAAASVTQRKAAADKSATLSAVQFAEVEYQVAKGSAAEAFALENVIRLRGIYVQSAAAAAVANNGLSASQARVAATGLTMANAMTALKTVTAPLGGPLGVVAIVAAGWYLYAQKQAEARKESLAFADTLPDVIAKLKEMNLAQAQGVRADTITSIKNQKEEINDLQGTISNLTAEYNEYNDLAVKFGVTNDENNGYVIKAKEAANELAKANRDLAGKTATLNQSQDALRLINIQVNQGIVDQMKAARDNAIALADAERKTSFLGSSQAFLAEKLGVSTVALQKFNAESLKINWGGSEGEKLIKQAERRLALAKLEGEEKARQQAAYDAEDAGTVDPLAIKRLQNIYAATEKVTQGRKDQKKEDKSAAAEGKKLENQQGSIVQKLSNLKQQSELAGESTKALTREQQLLRAEQSLGAGATDKQKKEAREYKAAAIDAADAAKGVTEALKNIPEKAESESYAESAKNLEAALKANVITKKEYDRASENAEREHQVNLAKIRSNSNSGVSPLQDAQGVIDPVQALANENARKLALIQQFETEKGAMTANGLALLNAQNTQYEQARIDAAWQIWENQSRANQMLGDAIDSLQGGATNAITGLLNGTQSLAESFANIGTTILNSVVSGLVEMGLQYVKNMIMGQAAATAALATTTAQATAAAAAWAPAAISASIATMGAASTAGTTAYSTALVASKGLAIAGARKNGGPVSAGSMYQVGEGGRPEIYQASTGKQYMIPGDNGKVISNKDMMGGGGVGTSLNQVMNLTVNTTNGLDDATIKQLRQAWKTDTMLIIRDQSTRPKGMLQGRK